jgi:outer membrane protein
MMQKPVLGVLALAALAGAAQAQENTFKAGISRYTTHERSNGVTGIGVPAGADVDVSDATTLVLTYERALTPNIGVEIALGIPPKLKARGDGTVAFLGEVLTTRIVAPTLFANYHFGTPGDALRPYLGVGVNYTRFTRIESTLAPSVEMGDSWGAAVQAGLDYAIAPNWGLFASVARIDVESKVVAAGATVIRTTVDFRPIVYTLGMAYRF